MGVALDGTGFGLDGHTWGGEILVADLQDFTRVTHLAYIEQSVREEGPRSCSGLASDIRLDAGGGAIGMGYTASTFRRFIRWPGCA